MGPRLKDADRADIPVVTTSTTLVEAYHAKLSRHAWRRALSRLRVEPITEAVAGDAIGLLENAGRDGHQHATDAVLAAVALRQPGRVTVFTSEEDDMRRLRGDRAVVVKL